MKPKLLLFSDDCHLGGSEMLVVNIIKNPLINKYFEVSFAYRYNRRYKANIDKLFSNEEKKLFYPIKLLSNDNINLELANFHPVIIRKLFYKLLYLVECTNIYSFINKVLLKKHFSKFAPDLIHVNNGGYPAALTCLDAVEVAGELKIKNILQINNIPSLAKQNRDAAIRRSVTYILTASKYTAKKIIEKRKIVSNNNLISLPNSVKMQVPTLDKDSQRELLKIRKEDIVIIEVALLLSYKGQLELLKALLLLKEKNKELYNQLSVILVGSGERENEIRKFVIQNRIENKVFLLGYRHDYINLINMSDILVLPSYDNEDMPLSILDAMSLGKPVISTNLAGIPEEVEHLVTGIIIEPDKEKLPILICDAICKIVNEKEFLGLNGKRRFLDNFSQEVYFNRLLNIYKKAIGTNLESQIMNK